MTNTIDTGEHKQALKYNIAWGPRSVTKHEDSDVARRVFLKTGAIASAALLTQSCQKAPSETTSTARGQSQDTGGVTSGQCVSENDDPQLKRIIEGFRKKIERDGGLDHGTLGINLGERRYILIDGRSRPNKVFDCPQPGLPPDCTITTTIDTIEAMIKGELDGVTAFRDREITVKGDLRIVMALGPIGVNRPEARPIGASDRWSTNGNLRFPFHIEDCECKDPAQE